MSCKGNCWDKVMMERFFRNLKMECVWHRHYVTRTQAIADFIHYSVGFYNAHRLHSTRGYRSPVDYENNTP